MSLFNYYETPPTAGLPIKWSDWLPKRKHLTTEISQLLNLTEPELTCSGTAAIVIALTTLARSNPTKKNVIVPAYTCPLVALAIHHCGLTIKLCDLADNSFDFDFTQLESLLDDSVLAVIPTHLGGRVADVAKVKKLVTPYNITIIEDAAQALGANVGAYGDITLYSLAAGKGLTLYEGGLLTTQNTHLREQMTTVAKELTPYSIRWELTRTIELLGYTALYNPWGLHFVYGNPRRKSLVSNQLIDAVGDYFDFELPLHKVGRFRQQIAANAAQRLPLFIKSTTKQALLRVTQLKKLNNLHVITDKTDTSGVWPFLMILLPTKQIRDHILNELWHKPLGVTRLFIHALSDYQYLKAIVPNTTPIPNAQDFANRMLTISNSLWFTDNQFDIVYETIEKNIQ